MSENATGYCLIWSVWPKQSEVAPQSEPSSGTEEIMGQISDGTVKQLGTFNGNPLTMAAAEATLTRVLDDKAYRRLEEAG